MISQCLVQLILMYVNCRVGFGAGRLTAGV